jgi:NAD(P)-dependent dehydrogenase (short-subunit alcohol dehydrogenase family)
MSLTGQVAVVTGGGRGIGLAVARALAAAGADVALLGRDRQELGHAAGTIHAAHSVRAFATPCDVTDADGVEAAFGAVSAELGAPSILVNNAGQSAGVPFAETTRELWDRMLAVNLTGSFLCTRAALPAMLAARRGRVVNIASTAGLKGYSHTAAYCAAKHGVVGLTRALATEVGRSGVTVNAVCPGYTDTDMARAAVGNLVRAGKTADEALRALTRGMPIGRLIRPEEVAGAVAWLCSAEAGAVTGEAIVVAGGEVT